MDGEWGETNVVDVVEDKELWTQPTLATPEPRRSDKAVTARHDACHALGLRSAAADLDAPDSTASDDDNSLSHPIMTSYFSSLLWGTSQLDDAVGASSANTHPFTASLTCEVPRQGNIGVTAKRFRRHCSQPRDMRPDSFQVCATQGCNARPEATAWSQEP